MNARSKIVFATEYEDARDTAKLTRDLTPEDFLALPKYHAYSNLVANGHPSGWALVETLPPPAAISDPEVVRATAHANYASMSETSIEEPTASAKNDSAHTSADTALAPVVADGQIGRKRRQR